MRGQREDTGLHRPIYAQDEGNQVSAAVSDSDQIIRREFRARDTWWCSLRKNGLVVRNMAIGRLRELSNSQTEAILKQRVVVGVAIVDWDLRHRTRPRE